MTSSLTRRGSTRRWRRIQEAILIRDRHTCRAVRDGHICGAHADTVGHIVRRENGGGDEPANLRAACSPCNIGRENRRRARPAPRWCSSSSLGR